MFARILRDGGCFVPAKIRFIGTSEVFNKMGNQNSCLVHLLVVSLWPKDKTFWMFERFATRYVLLGFEKES